MSPRHIFVFCEGQHDIAFLTRLLTVSATVEFASQPINKLPEPFGSFFVGRLGARNANHAKVGGKGPVSPDEPPLLEAVCKTPDNSRLWYFLNCCGDSRSKEINSFLNPIIELAQASDPEKRLSNIGFVFVNDADEMGVSARKQLVTDHHSTTISRLLPNFGSIEANAVQREGSYGAATCIFHDKGSVKGSLENLIWSLWSSEHLHRRDSSLTLMTSLATSGTKIGPDSTPSKILKASLTTAGQTECPSFSLAVVLRDTNALNEAAMKEDTACKTLVKALTEV